MTSRSFSWAVIIGFELLFAGTVFANFFVDPQGVFGGEATHRQNPNWRYLQFEHYRRDASQIEGLILASSRGHFLDDNLFASQSGIHEFSIFRCPSG